MNDLAQLTEMDRDLVVCAGVDGIPCGHIESFHDDGKGDKGTWCFALGCGCPEFHPKERAA